MSKMSELDNAVKELRWCGEALIGIAETLRELFSASEPAPEEPINIDDFETIYDPAEDEPKPVTLEQVRAKLSEISRSGKTAAVKELLGKYDASKLSDVHPKNYAALLADAEVL